MSLKKVYQFRRYIVTQAFMQWIIIHFIAIIFSGKLWSSFFSSVIEIVFCAFLWYMIYLYHNENLKFDVIIDDECIIESRYIYYQCVIMGGVWLLGVLIYSRYADQPSIAYIVISLFLVAPLFWLKLCYRFVIFVWSHIFRIFFDVSTIHKMSKKSDLSVLEGFLQFQFMQSVDECFDADFDLGITDEDLKSVGSKLSKRVNTHGHTKEFIEELKDKNSKTEKWAFITRIVIPCIFLLFSLYASSTGSIAGSVNYNAGSTAEQLFQEGWRFANTNNYVKAAEYYRKAAEQGNIGAQVNLGVLYKNGKGVKQDNIEAERWFRKAAEQGDANAQFNMGILYAYGYGVKQDYEEAAQWYRKAAEQGHVSAQNNLGNLYNNGLGVAKSEIEAVKWYRKAAEQGYSVGQFNLALSYDRGEGVKQDYTEAAQWYRKAAEQGHDNAQYRLGTLYLEGDGVTKDFEKAMKFLQQADAQGHKYAPEYIGLMYENGWGVNKNMNIAKQWYEKAAARGNINVKAKLK